MIVIRRLIVLLLLFVLLLLCAPLQAHAAPRHAHIATTVMVNGSALSATVAPGATITATVAGGPGNAGDWLGVYTVGVPTPQTNPASWKWLKTDTTNSEDVPPPPGISAGTVHLVVPSLPGQYEVRFFPNNGWTVTATSAPITVGVAVVPPPVVTGQLTKEITWVSGQGLGSVPIWTPPQAATIVAMSCRIETPVGAAATFFLVKAPSGKLLSSGAQISPNPCDANAATPINQNMLPAGKIAVNPGDTIGISTSSQAALKAGSGMGLVTVGYTIP